MQDKLQKLSTREVRVEDDAPLEAIMQRQMAAEPGWPPEYARSQKLADWLAAPATIGRWVAVDENGVIFGHVGCAPVGPGPRADMWQSALHCTADKMALVCRLVVDPDRRRSGVSALLTRRAMRAAIEAGYVPVANVLGDRSSSLAMMSSAGWTPIGEDKSESTGLASVIMIPPQKLIDIALGPGDAN